MSPRTVIKQIFLRENRQLNVLVATLFMALLLWAVDSLLGATFFYGSSGFRVGSPKVLWRSVCRPIASIK